jgi:hypothetical protein
VVETLLLEVYDHVDFEGDLFYFEDGGGGDGGRVLRKRVGLSLVPLVERVEVI